MEEIAETFQALGLTERTFQGAADIYSLVKETSLGKETPEEREPTRNFSEIITILSQESTSNNFQTHSGDFQHD
jgi:hypothetical protein